jgi:hypothetical protein
MPPESDTASVWQPTVYKLEPSRFAEYHRELAIRLGIVMPLVAAGFLYLAWHFDKRRITFLLVLIPILTVQTVYRRFKDEGDKWKSLVFEFRDGKLIRRLDKYPTVELAPSEVTAILESPQGIIVKTNKRSKVVFLSNKLVDYEMLRSRLLSWAPTVRVTGWRRSYWDYTRSLIEVLVCLCLFGGPLYLMYAPQHAIILPLGVVLSLAMLGMILHVRNSPQIPTSRKKGLWILVLLPIFAMLVRLYLN